MYALIKRDPNPKNKWSDIACAYQKIADGKLQQAKKSITGIISLNPENAAAHFCLSAIYFKQELADKTLKHQKKAFALVLKKNPSCIDDRTHDAANKPVYHIAGQVTSLLPDIAKKEYNAWLALHFGRYQVALFLYTQLLVQQSSNLSNEQTVSFLILKIYAQIKHEELDICSSDIYNSHEQLKHATLLVEQALSQIQSPNQFASILSAVSIPIMQIELQKKDIAQLITPVVANLLSSKLRELGVVRVGPLIRTSAHQQAFGLVRQLNAKIIYDLITEENDQQAAIILGFDSKLQPRLGLNSCIKKRSNGFYHTAFEHNCDTVVSELFQHGYVPRMGQSFAELLLQIINAAGRSPRALQTAIILSGELLQREKLSLADKAMCTILSGDLGATQKLLGSASPWHYFTPTRLNTISAQTATLLQDSSPSTFSTRQLKNTYAAIAYYRQKQDELLFAEDENDLPPRPVRHQRPRGKKTSQPQYLREFRKWSEAAKAISAWGSDGQTSRSIARRKNRRRQRKTRFRKNHSTPLATTVNKSQRSNLTSNIQPLIKLLSENLPDVYLAGGAIYSALVKSMHRCDYPPNDHDFYAGFTDCKETRRLLLGLFARQPQNFTHWRIEHIRGTHEHLEIYDEHSKIADLASHVPYGGMSDLLSRSDQLHKTLCVKLGNQPFKITTATVTGPHKKRALASIRSRSIKTLKPMEQDPIILWRVLKEMARGMRISATLLKHIQMNLPKLRQQVKPSRVLTNLLKIFAELHGHAVMAWAVKQQIFTQLLPFTCAIKYTQLDLQLIFKVSYFVANNKTHPKLFADITSWDPSAITIAALLLPVLRQLQHISDPYTISISIDKFLFPIQNCIRTHQYCVLPLKVRDILLTYALLTKGISVAQKSWNQGAVILKRIMEVNIKVPTIRGSLVVPD